MYSKNRKKEGIERDYDTLKDGDNDEFREGEHEDGDADDLFRDDEEFGEKDDEEEVRAGREKVEQKEDSFDIFGDDE